MAKRKATYKTRDPQATSRDPEDASNRVHRAVSAHSTVARPEPSAPREPRRYIPASAPTVCPECGGNTRMDDGRHVMRKAARHIAMKNGQIPKDFGDKTLLSEHLW